MDAALFDMDGTLVDSIGAVEKAWGDVAESLGRDRQEVIELTHGQLFLSTMTLITQVSCGALPRSTRY